MPPVGVHNHNDFDPLNKLPQPIKRADLENVSITNAVARRQAFAEQVAGAPRSSSGRVTLGSTTRQDSLVASINPNVSDQHGPGHRLKKNMNMNIASTGGVDQPTNTNQNEIPGTNRDPFTGRQKMPPAYQNHGH